MQVHVVSDERGRIISVSKLGDVGEQVSGISRAGVLPEPGQQVHLIELGEEFGEVPLLDLHQQLRVDITSGRPRLVRMEDFVEPYLKEPHLSDDAPGEV